MCCLGLYGLVAVCKMLNLEVQVQVSDEAVADRWEWPWARHSKCSP